jgi:GT2 family glycosyltransferase
VICTYNRQDDLRRALEALLTLTYADREVIVVDNNSTDGTQAVIDAFPVRCVRESRQGLSHARNAGIEAVRGEWLLYFDDDTTVETPDLIERMLKTAESDPRIGMVGCRIEAVQVGEGDPNLAAMFLDTNGQDLGPEDRVYPEPPALIGACLMYRMEALGDIRCRPELGRRGRFPLGREELDISERIHARGWASAYCASAWVKHWIRGSRFTWSWVLKHQFAEGLSEFMELGWPLWRRRWHKPLTEAIAVLLAALTFQGARRRKRTVRLARAVGVAWGPVFQRLNPAD